MPQAVVSLHPVNHLVPGFDCGRRVNDQKCAFVATVFLGSRDGGSKTQLVQVGGRWDAQNVEDVRRNSLKRVHAGLPRGISCKLLGARIFNSNYPRDLAAIEKILPDAVASFAARVQPAEHALELGVAIYLDGLTN